MANMIPSQIEAGAPRSDPRCLFEGAAGTGKTLLAVEYARRRARDGQRVLLVCFNRLLGTWLRGRCEDIGTITAGTWHDTLRQFILASSVGEEFQERSRALNDDEKSTLFKELYPFYGEIALEELDAPPFDVLVVDEAQDLLLEPANLPVFDRTMRGGLFGGRWAMFGDFTRQALYYDRARGSEERSPVAGLERYYERRRLVADFKRGMLTRNCRNTRSIAEATAHVAGFETPPCRASAEPGLPVKYLPWRTPDGWVDVLAETIQRLRKDGVPTKEIMVLAPGRAERDTLVARGRIADQPVIDCSQDPAAERQGIRIATIHAFKGLESPVVIIAGVKEKKDWTRSQSLFYVGCRGRAATSSSSPPGKRMKP